MSSSNYGKPSYELVGFSARLYPKGTPIHLKALSDETGWWLLPSPYARPENHCTPIPDAEVLEQRLFTYGAFDRLFRADIDLIHLRASFIGNSNHADGVGGLHFEVMQSSLAGVFGEWREKLIDLVQHRLEGQKPFPLGDGAQECSFITLWEYRAGTYDGDEYWSEWEPVGDGLVDDRVVEGLADAIRTADAIRKSAEQAAMTSHSVGETLRQVFQAGAKNDGEK